MRSVIDADAWLSWISVADGLGGESAEATEGGANDVFVAKQSETGPEEGERDSVAKRRKRGREEEGGKRGGEGGRNEEDSE